MNSKRTNQVIRKLRALKIFNNKLHRPIKCKQEMQNQTQQPCTLFPRGRVENCFKGSQKCQFKNKKTLGSIHEDSSQALHL